MKDKFHREIISSDFRMGDTPSAYIILRKGNMKYTLDFSEAEEQLSIEYAYRDRPIIPVYIEEAARVKESEILYESIGGAYYVLSANELAVLYEMAISYNKKEKVTVF